MPRDQARDDSFFLSYSISLLPQALSPRSTTGARFLPAGTLVTFFFFSCFDHGNTREFYYWRDGLGFKITVPMQHYILYSKLNASHMVIRGKKVKGEALIAIPKSTFLDSSSTITSIDEGEVGRIRRPMQTRHVWRSRDTSSCV